MKHIIKIFSVLVICVSMPAIVHAAAMTQAERIDKCLAAVNKADSKFQIELRNLIAESTLARTETDYGEAELKNLVKSIHIPITSIFSQKIKEIDDCQNAINDLQARSKLKLHLFGNKKYAYYINPNELNKYRRVKYYIWLNWDSSYKPGTIIKKEDFKNTEPFWDQQCMSHNPIILPDDFISSLYADLPDYRSFSQRMFFDDSTNNILELVTRNSFPGILSCYAHSKITFTGFKDPGSVTNAVNKIQEKLSSTENRFCASNTKNGGPLVLYIGILNNTSYNPREGLDESEPNATEFTIISGPYPIQ